MMPPDVDAMEEDISNNNKLIIFIDKLGALTPNPNNDLGWGFEGSYDPQDYYQKSNYQMIGGMPPQVSAFDES